MMTRSANQWLLLVVCSRLCGVAPKDVAERHMLIRHGYENSAQNVFLALSGTRYKGIATDD